MPRLSRFLGCDSGGSVQEGAHEARVADQPQHEEGGGSVQDQEGGHEVRVVVQPQHEEKEHFGSVEEAMEVTKKDEGEVDISSVQDAVEGPKMDNKEDDIRSLQGLEEEKGEKQDEVELNEVASEEELKSDEEELKSEGKKDLKRESELEEEEADLNEVTSSEVKLYLEEELESENKKELKSEDKKELKPEYKEELKSEDKKELKSDDKKELKLEDKKEDESFRAERANRNTLLLLSVLLVLAMPVVVWLSISQPVLIIWRLSLLLCCCTCIWFRLLDAAMSMQTMLLFFSHGFMLALYADAMLDPNIGMLIAHLISHSAAGILGYALAKHRQRNGSEVSAAIAAACQPSDEEADRQVYFQKLCGLYFSLPTLGCAAYVAWVLSHRADYPAEDLLVRVFLPLLCAIMFWILFVDVMLLHSALLGEAGVCLLLICMMSLGLVFIMFYILLGDTVALMVFLYGFHGAPGFLGYSLSVYASLKLRLKLGQPQLKACESQVESPRPDEGLEKPLLEAMPLFKD